jgi:putative hydrolase
MSDSIFDRLFELFQSPGPVNWRLAAEVRKSLAGTVEPVDPHLAEEYSELARAAELRLATATHLDVGFGGSVQPVDRATWAESNERSFRYAIEPLAGKLLAAPLDQANPMAAMLAPMGPAVLGMQAGTMVGFMAHRVIGQFDAGLPPLDEDELFLVVPNTESFAVDHSLDPRQVRMWAAAHEVLHHAVVSVPWLRTRILAVMDAFYGAVHFDPSNLTDALSRVEDPQELEGMLGGAGGLASLMGAEHDPALLGPIQAVLAAVAGYGDFVVRRALGDVLPDIDRLEEAVARRRAEPNQAEQFLQQLVGLELERHRANDAAAFFAQIERRWGVETIERVWADPANLPSISELTDPVGWAARVLLDDPASGDEAE